MVRLFTIGFVLLVLAGCQERYRYPCQDPNNWEEQMCKKPYCSANGTCPEDLKHYEKNKVVPPQPQPMQTPIQPTKKGDCKC